MASVHFRSTMFWVLVYYQIPHSLPVSLWLTYITAGLRTRWSVGGFGAESLPVCLGGLKPQSTGNLKYINKTGHTFNGITEAYTFTSNSELPVSNSGLTPCPVTTDSDAGGDTRNLDRRCGASDFKRNFFRKFVAKKQMKKMYTRTVLR